VLPERIISADDHMDMNVLPPDLFVRGVPSAMRASVPTVVASDDGPMWSLEGALLGPSGRRAKGLVNPNDPGFRPGTPSERLEDMDLDGIHAHVVYGPPLSLPIPDLEVRAACLRAYNDWSADFNRTDPNRLVVLALLPSHTPEAATVELERVAALGHRGAIVDFLAGEDAAFEDSWERFWATANELAIPISFHLGKGLHSIKVKAGSWRMAAGVAVSPMQLDEVLTGMILSGLLERYPNVRVVFGEAGLGWVPYLLARLDHEQEKYRDLISDAKLTMSPREYFRRQVFLTYEEDHLGIELLPHIGATNVLWASDYPHGDSTWPHSREAILASGLGQLDDVSQRLILWDNAASLYNIA
jgi:predicted TIM-barrel fold metal-dependent hydrolase